MNSRFPFLVKEFPITSEMVDYNGHVNNVVFVQWMQDVAIEHATKIGFDRAFYDKNEVSWVARYHRIEYRKSAYEGEKVVAVTWIADARKVACRRQYEFRRNTAEGETLSIAETEWVFVDQKTGRPQKLLPELMNRFDILGKEFPHIDGA